MIGLGAAILGGSLISGVGSYLAGAEQSEAAKRGAAALRGDAPGSFRPDFEGLQDDIDRFGDWGEKYNKFGDQWGRRFNRLGKRGMKEFRAAGDQAYGRFTNAGKRATRNFTPYMQAGRKSLNRLSSMLNDGKFGSFWQSPGYQARLEAGERATERAASAAGGARGGRVALEMARRNQEFASNEYGSYVNRLFGMANMGMGATNASNAAKFNWETAADNARSRSLGMAYDTRRGYMGAASNAQLAGMGGASNADLQAINLGLGVNRLGIGHNQAIANQANIQGQADASQWAGIANAANNGLTNYAFMNALG